MLFRSDLLSRFFPRSKALYLALNIVLMIRITFILIFLLASGFSTGSVNNVLSESERWNKHASNTEIIRDDFGVPHIYGKTDEEVAYGLAWATCEDDIKSMRENLLTARGRLGELKGKGFEGYPIPI